MRNEKRNKACRGIETKERKKHQDGQKRDELLQEWRERFCAECRGARSPEQTLANRGAVVRVRVDQGRGQQHQDVKCDRSILGLQHRNPSLL